MPNNPSKKYCNSACYQENRSKKNNESFFTPAGAKVKGKRSHDTLSSPAGSGFAANNASKKAKLGQGGVATEFEEIVTVFSLQGQIGNLEKDIVIIKLAFADNAIQSYKERSVAGQTSLPVPEPGKNTYATAVRGQACPVLIANYAEGAKTADRVYFTEVKQMLGAGMDKQVPQRVRQKDDNL
ncbi:hypothetical protein DAPPUDRAFT_106705 [Daphnia pulex]|uniref:Uncharacterized protein n=1 Tax=Daphnia pulex TaxID=6669 RepID=E9GUV2_DAPPU|nr:hypothetical protein DAPPUDRAFT_106705 [Daphnia pulex]|eukprot:EFX76803.1 hypothetical protein DAPPUDRAFT_106705 [Daphnia pulex]